MKWSLLLHAFVCAGLMEISLSSTAFAQNQGSYQVASTAGALRNDPKFKLLLFWRENDSATQAMADGLKAALASRSNRAEWTAINLNDAAQRSTVEAFHVGRAPMPLVLSIAPNGAVVGAISSPITDEAIERVLVTRAKADVTKALQLGRIVLIHARSEAQRSLPNGAAELMADPMYRDRTTLVDVVASDPDEAKFVKELELTTADTSESTIIVLAPPGAFVGKFPPHATSEQIATALHAAGNCCNDPNCKHNQ